MSPSLPEGVSFADSPFLHSPSTIQPHRRTIVHLTRDLIQPLFVLPPNSSESSTPLDLNNNNNNPTSENDIPTADANDIVYTPKKKKRKSHSGRTVQTNNASGPVYTTRFGNFPHQKLIGLPLGSQVQSSSSFGFIHVLNPTPELWTTSLPHRTQVVYTPDSSYILHRLRVRPGSRVIEAGAGSGSFTHASVRAVYEGLRQDGNHGKVFSFEFHSERVGVLKGEVRKHGLDGLVEVIGRDVCVNGFGTVPVKSSSGTSTTNHDGQNGVAKKAEEEEKYENIDASAIFLDLPAPWLAVPHLTRRRLSDGKRGPLSPYKTVYLCCFSPCLEQSLRTISVLRSLHWAEIDLVEIAHKKLEVRRMGPHGREITGKPSRQTAEEEGSNPVSLNEAVENMVGVLEHRKKAQAAQAAQARARKEGVEFEKKNTTANGAATGGATAGGGGDDNSDDEGVEGDEKQDVTELRKKMLHAGRVITRPEPDLKTHTSYLVFATLPLPWTAEDEAKAAEKYPITKVPDVGNESSDAGVNKVKKGKTAPTEGSKRSLKKEERKRKLEEIKNNKEGNGGGDAGIDDMDVEDL